MIHVSHLFRWRFPNGIGAKNDFIWCRMWSDTSWSEMATAMLKIRNRQPLWLRDGDSVPYYLLTPADRRNAIKLGARITDWNNPQLDPAKKLHYARPTSSLNKHEKQYREQCEASHQRHQQEAQSGTYELLSPEEAVLAAQPPVRRTRQRPGGAPTAPAMPENGHGDPSHHAPGSEPAHPGQLAAGVPPLPQLDRAPRGAEPGTGPDQG